MSEYPKYNVIKTGQCIIKYMTDLRVCERIIVLLFFMVVSVWVRVKAALGVWILVTQVTIESERCEGRCTLGNQAEVTHNNSKSRILKQSRLLQGSSSSVTRW